MRKFALALAVAAGLTAVVTPAASADEVKILHSYGYQSIYLGMSEDQLRATGLVRDQAPSTGECTTYSWQPGEGSRPPMTQIFVSKTRGVEKIDGTDPMTTPRGIASGSTYLELTQAHPGGTQDAYRYRVAAPENPRAHYEFDATLRQGVSQIALSLDETTCAY